MEVRSNGGEVAFEPGPKLESDGEDEWVALWRGKWVVTQPSCPAQVVTHAGETLQMHIQAWPEDKHIYRCPPVSKEFKHVIEEEAEDAGLMYSSSGAGDLAHYIVYKEGHLPPEIQEQNAEEAARLEDARVETARFAALHKQAMQTKRAVAKQAKKAEATSAPQPGDPASAGVRRRPGSALPSAPNASKRARMVSALVAPEDLDHDDD